MLKEAIGIIDAEYDYLKELSRKEIIEYLTQLNITEETANEACTSFGL